MAIRHRPSDPRVYLRALGVEVGANPQEGAVGAQKGDLW